MYLKFNRRSFVHPDPLEFLYSFHELKDREIAGLVASSLAYGKVRQILKSVSIALKKISPPYDFLINSDTRFLLSVFRDFRHRFTTGKNMALMLAGAKSAILKYGSLEQCFKAGFVTSAPNILPALELFVKELSSEFDSEGNYLLPLPSRGSACKRLNLYLRWMVRCDNVDPGDWSDIPKSKLLIPLDTHMWRICRRLGFTSRKQADMKAVLEVTSAFRRFCPDDPVRYDFALTRFGIRKDVDMKEILNWE